MASLSEQAKELYSERLEQQDETNKQIAALIVQAKQDQNKYVPYGPILMNVYGQA